MFDVLKNVSSSCQAHEKLLYLQPVTYRGDIHFSVFSLVSFTLKKVTS